MPITRAHVIIRRGPMYDPRICAIAKSLIANSLTRNAYGELTINVDDLIAEKCGIYSRGKHTGKLRGWATWNYVERGGWVSDGPGYMNGHVVRPGHAYGLTISDFNGKIYLSI